MKDTNSIWEEAAREARAEYIATHRIVPLRHDMTQGQRITLNLQALAAAAASLHANCSEIPEGDEPIELMDEVETHVIATLKFLEGRKSMRASVDTLAGLFGRAPS